MDIIGKATIHPFLFYTAKASGLFAVLAMALSLAGYDLFIRTQVLYSAEAGIVLFIAGVFLSGVSLINLGSSTRMGLPLGKTTFKTKGLYRYSRNPMYLGLYLASLGAMLYFLHFIVIIATLTSILIHHFIILGEERYLESQYGKAYTEYRKKTRRYL
jgi:protein-S-isoprenylcysteine O-methyltransferase Ste14